MAVEDPSMKEQIGPMTQAMARKMEEEDGT